ncbi:MAG: class I adenylate-forming enzyme family protein [Acidimicrobiales bacterium]
MDDIVAIHAGLQPDKILLIDDRPGTPPVTYTFAQANKRSNQSARLLMDVGVRAGSKVVWCGQNSASVIVLAVAIRKVGAIGVPLNYRFSPSEAAYVIDNCDAEIVMVDAEYAELIEATRPDAPKLREVLVFDGDGLLEGRVDDYPTEEVQPEDDSPGGTMIYTSGTTGQPKGAVRTGAPNVEQTRAFVRLIGYQPDDVYITTGPLYHSGPGGFATLALALGNTIVLQHKFDPEDWLRLVDTYQVTTTFTAPTPIRMVCSLPAEVKDRYDRSSMKRFIANAAPWSLALKKLYLADFPTDSLWEVYGSTELGVDTVLGPEDHLRRPGSCGRAAPGVDIKLFDDDGAEVTEAHVKGELYVRADNVYSAYYKAEEKYQADMRGEYHTVGDVAYFDEDGYFYIADRKRDMIISGGMNIYPAEIEAVLDQSPDIYEAAVIGIPNVEWGESVHAVVVPAHPGVSADAVVEFARTELAGYKVPRTVSFVAELPKTGSGKVLKRELRAPYWGDPDTGG